MYGTVRSSLVICSCARAMLLLVARSCCYLNKSLLTCIAIFPSLCICPLWVIYVLLPSFKNIRCFWILENVCIHKRRPNFAPDTRALRSIRIVLRPGLPFFFNEPFSSSMFPLYISCILSQSIIQQI